MLICDFLIEAAKKFPLKTAIKGEEETITYEALLEKAGKLACALNKTGMGAGDRVILYEDNSVAYVIAYFGVLLAGGVTVGLSTGSRARQLIHHMRHCRAKGVITAGRHLKTVQEAINSGVHPDFVFYNGSQAEGSDNIREFQSIFEEEEFVLPKPQRGEEDLAQIIYTSGTTAAPKGVMLSHKNLKANTESIVNYLNLTQKDSMLAVLPFYYSYGNSLLLTHVQCGACLVLDNRFAYPKKILERMDQEKVTGFAGVPSTFAILTHKAGLKDKALPHLRYITQAGGPMAPALAEELRQALPNTRIFIMYGQTEASARLSYLPPEELLTKSGSIGVPIPGVTLTLKDKSGAETAPGEVGEIVAKGDNIMMGYWEDEAATKKVLQWDGLHTGDLAIKDQDNYLYIVSRKSDMIKSGAHRISPKEIEEVILEDKRVHETAVIGKPDPLMGEVIVAVVVPKANETIKAREIAMICSKNLPPYKVPKQIEFRTRIEKSASGKIKKHILRKELEGAKT